MRRVVVMGGVVGGGGGWKVERDLKLQIPNGCHRLEKSIMEHHHHEPLNYYVIMSHLIFLVPTICLYLNMESHVTQGLNILSVIVCGSVFIHTR